MNEWIGIKTPVDKFYDIFMCNRCNAIINFPYEYCPKCGLKINNIHISYGQTISCKDYIKTIR